MKLILREDVSIQANGRDDKTVVQWQVGHQPLSAEFTQATPGICAALQTLTRTGVTLRELVNIVLKKDGFLASQKLYGYVQILEQASLIHRFVANGTGPVVTLVPNSPYYKFRQEVIVPEQKYLLSRFAYWHREDDYFVLESPMGLAKLRWHDGQALTFILTWRKPCSLLDLANHLPALSYEKLESIFVFLLNASLLTKVDPQGQIQEETNEALQQWEFHDLLFHTRSRMGRTTEGYGGTYRFQGQIPPLPVIKPPMSAECIVLDIPNLERLALNDTSLTAVMEARRSIRDYDDENPITAHQIGEFLYRVARVKRVYERTQNSPIELSQRPYPSGGAQYELELYLSIRHCQGIAAGFYHYCPSQHRLYKIKTWNNQIAQLVKKGSAVSGKLSPQILITIAARFQRVAWKYESMAYALMLKNCGVLYQSMYLVATAMGLAPCGLGGGDSDLFAQIAGTDYYAETSIGEFALGSTPQ